MHHSRRPQPDEVEQLLRNAELRDELERYFDESLTRVNIRQLPLAVENEYLACMLAWEQAPVLPIYRWFEPELRPPRPESLSDEDLHHILWDVIYKLYEKRIVLDFTDHLSDRELYTLIFRDILPAREKKLDWPGNALLCHRRRAPRLGPTLSPAVAAQLAAALSAQAAPRAVVSSSPATVCSHCRPNCPSNYRARATCLGTHHHARCCCLKLLNLRLWALGLCSLGSRPPARPQMLPWLKATCAPAGRHSC